MTRFILPLAVGVLLLAGCSNSGGGTSDSPAGPARADTQSEGRANQAEPGQDQMQPEAAQQQAQPGGEQQQPAPPKEGTGDTSNTAPQQPIEGRSLIFRAQMSVRVENVGKAADQLNSMATTAGGFISSEKRAISEDESQATIVVRIPSKQYAGIMEKISKELGRELSRGSNVEDVTEAIVDLDTRIAAQKASVESVRRMFERAASLQEVVLLEKELNQRQAELASLEAKKKRLDDLVALSTITVTLVGPNTVIEPEPQEQDTFLTGLKHGWNALVETLRLVSVVLGFVLPFLLLAGVALLVLIWLLRLRRRGVKAVPPSPAEQAGQAD